MKNGVVVVVERRPFIRCMLNGSERTDQHGDLKQRAFVFGGS